MELQRGTPVDVTTAGGSHVNMRALGGPRMGRDFEVIPVCTEDDWKQVVVGELEQDAVAIPWPSEAVFAR